MRTHRCAIVCIVILIALTARFGSTPHPHQLSLVNQDGSFHFSADELPDGSHVYGASYVWENGWWLSPQYEAGRLSEKDWRALNSLRRSDRLPKADDSHLEESGETWGLMKRGDETIVLRYAEWWELSDTQVPVSLHSMCFKAKASL